MRPCSAFVSALEIRFFAALVGLLFASDMRATYSVTGAFLVAWNCSNRGSGSWSKLFANGTMLDGYPEMRAQLAVGRCLLWYPFGWGVAELRDDHRACPSLRVCWWRTQLPAHCYLASLLRQAAESGRQPSFLEECEAHEQSGNEVADRP